MLSLHADGDFLVPDQMPTVHSVCGISPAVSFLQVYAFTDCELCAGRVLAIQIYYDIQDQF